MSGTKNLRIAGLALAAVGLLTVAAFTATIPPDGAPSVTNVTWIEQPDTRIPIEAIPWCDDSDGHSPTYPCRWDARERPPSPAWDPSLPPIAVWVTRSQGCPVGRIKIAEDNSIGWSCFWVPGS